MAEVSITARVALHNGRVFLTVWEEGARAPLPWDGAELTGKRGRKIARALGAEEKVRAMFEAAADERREAYGNAVRRQREAAERAATSLAESRRLMIESQEALDGWCRGGS